MEENLQEWADSALENIRSFINHEQQFIKKEHSFANQVHALDQPFHYLFNEVFSDKKLQALINEVLDLLRDLKNWVDTSEINDVRLIKEEQNILQQMKVDKERKKWKVVKDEVKSEEKAEEAVLNLELHEIRKIHDIFLEIMKLMKRSKLLALDEDMTKEKKDYANKIDYYFNQIYKFIRTYERIFRHLWKKEKQLYDNLRKNSPRA